MFRCSVRQEKASEMDSKIKKTDFKCSKNWLEHFKKIHFIGEKIVREFAAVHVNVVNEWLTNVWSNIQRNFACNDTFNSNKTSLFLHFHS